MRVFCFVHESKKNEYMIDKMVHRIVYTNVFFRRSFEPTDKSLSLRKFAYFLRIACSSNFFQIALNRKQEMDAISVQTEALN